MFDGAMGFDRRLAPGVAVAVLVLVVAGLVAVVSHRPPLAAAAPAAHAGDDHAAAAGHVDMGQLQTLVQTAHCPEPGSQVAGGTPTSTVEVVADGSSYGDGPLTVTAGELVRLRLVNDDDVDHEVGVFHESRPGCPLVLVTAPAGEAAEADLRLAEGTYVYGDRGHPGERDLLTAVQSPAAARP